MRSIRAWNPLPQVGHMWVGVSCWILAALALRVSRFFSAVLRSSTDRAPMTIRLRQVGRSETGASHESVSVEKSFRDLQAIFEALTLPSDRALVLAGLTIEQLLWDAVVRHAGDVVYPSDLGLAHDGDNVGITRWRNSVSEILFCQQMLRTGIT